MAPAIGLVGDVGRDESEARTLMRRLTAMRAKSSAPKTPAPSAVEVSTGWFDGPDDGKEESIERAVSAIAGARLVFDLLRTMNQYGDYRYIVAGWWLFSPATRLHQHTSLRQSLRSLLSVSQKKPN